MTAIGKAPLMFAAACIVAAGAGCAAPWTDSGSASGTPISFATALSTKFRGTAPELAVVGNGFSVTAGRLSGAGQSDVATGIILAMPPTAAQPRFTPQQAFDALVAGGNISQSRLALSPPEVKLVLFTDLQTGDIRPDGKVKPFWTGVLAWTFLYTDIFPERNAPLPPGSTPAPVKSTEMNVILVVDANTGKFLTEQDGITLLPRK